MSRADDANLAIEQLAAILANAVRGPAFAKKPDSPANSELAVDGNYFFQEGENADALGIRGMGKVIDWPKNSTRLTLMIANACTREARRHAARIRSGRRASLLDAVLPYMLLDSRSWPTGVNQ